MTKKLLLLVATLSLVSLWAFGQQGGDASRFKIALNDEPYLRAERIVGFEIKIVHGGFAAMPSLPIGWSFNVDNSASWECSASGLVAVGAAAMSKDALEQMFLIIPAPDADGPPKVTVAVHTTKDFEKSTRHEQANVKLVRVP